MSENLYSPSQKVLSKEGKDNWDRIFKPRLYIFGSSTTEIYDPDGVFRKEEK